MAKSTGTTIAQPNILFTADTSQLTREVQQTKAEVAQAAKAFEAGFAKGAAKAERAMTKTASSAQSIQKDFKGAGTAISGATASLQLLGQQGPPAIQTLSSAVSSLIESGFGGIGVAVGAATAAIGFLIKAVGDYRDRLKETQTELKRTTVDVRRLNLELEAARRGMSASDVADEQSLEFNRKQLEAALYKREALERDIEALESRARNFNGGFGSTLSIIEARVESLKEERNAADGLVNTYRNQVANLELKQQRQAEILDIQEQTNESTKKEADETRRGARAAVEWKEATVERAKTIRELLDEMLQKPDGGPNRDPLPSLYPELPDKGDLRPPTRTESTPDVDFDAAAFNRELDALERVDQERDRVAKGLRLEREGVTFAKIWGLDETQQELSELELTSRRLGETFSSSFGAAITDSLLEARNLGDALRDVGKLLLQTAVQLGISGGVRSAFSFAGLPGFATGGSFTVGGFGGTDSQLVAFKATPGEQVSVSPPGRGGGMNVNIHNYAGARVATRESEGPSGPQLDVLIEDVVSRSIEGGGKVSRALSRANGLRRRGRRG